MRLNEIFRDGMVLQAGKPVRVFGYGGGNASVELCGHTASYDDWGTDWEVELPAMDYGGPYDMKVRMCEREITLHDIYIGDVYLFAGQSNMQFKLRESYVEESAYESDGMLRLYVPDRIGGGDYFSPDDGWVKCEKETAGWWPCLGYMAGIELAEKKDRAVGIVGIYHGAADIQCFLPPRSFEDKRLDTPKEERFDIAFPWNGVNSVIYDFSVKKIAPFSFGAVVWYQGESNTGPAESPVYDLFLKELIKTWREDFRDENLKFAVVQIADCDDRAGECWTNIQKCQEKCVAETENTVLVISRDVCETTDIHPRNKEKLAERIAKALQN